MARKLRATQLPSGNCWLVGDVPLFLQEQSDFTWVAAFAGHDSVYLIQIERNPL